MLLTCACMRGKLLLEELRFWFKQFSSNFKVNWKHFVARCFLLIWIMIEQQSIIVPSLKYSLTFVIENRQWGCGKSVPSFIDNNLDSIQIRKQFELTWQKLLESYTYNTTQDLKIKNFIVKVSHWLITHPWNSIWCWLERKHFY